MKLCLLILGFVSMVNTATFAQVPFVSVGYTSANIINYDLQRFGQKALSVNEGDTLKINELRKGFNIGLGYQYTDINSDVNGYFRGGLNYAFNLGNVFKNKNDFKSWFNSIDAMLVAGIGKRIGESDFMVAFYGLGGGSFMFETLKLDPNYGIGTDFKSNRFNFNYGVGVGLVDYRGISFNLEVVFASPPSIEKRFYRNDSGKLAEDFDSYKTLGDSYSGAYVSPNWKYGRLDLKITIPLVYYDYDE